jgi:hypothetical protein
MASKLIMCIDVRMKRYTWLQPTNVIWGMCVPLNIYMRDIDYVLQTYSLNCWMSFFLWIMSVLGRAIARMSAVTLKKNTKLIFVLVKIYYFINFDRYILLKTYFNLGFLNVRVHILDIALVIFRYILYG